MAWILMAVACATPSAAQTAAERDAIVAQDPPARPQALKLADLPAATGAARELFNGRDLADWEPWLGYADPAITYTRPAAKPLGQKPQASTIFSVVTEDGAPALRVDGRIWGSLVHKADLADYHLSLEYKWSGKRWAPRLDQPENNGLLFHSHGEPGVVFGTWMRAVEFEIMKGSTGMVVPVGENIRARTRVAHDPAIVFPHRRFRLDGRPHELTNAGNPDWNVENAVDAEKPVGEWNRVDLYVHGDAAIYVVNGVPVMALTDLAELDAAGQRVPLTHGRIQLQSEGAETFFRNIRVEPIAALPKLVEE